MADRFDGTRFLGVDDDMVGDGSDANSQPLDTLVENVIDNDTIDVWEHGWSVGYSFADSGEVTRPIASWAQCAFFRMDLYMDPAPEALEIQCVCDVLNDVDNDAEVRVTFKVGSFGAPFRQESDLVQDTSAGGQAVARRALTNIPDTPDGAAFAPVWICVEQTRGRNQLPDVRSVSVDGQNQDLLTLAADINLRETEVLEVEKFLAASGGYVGTNYFTMADVIDAENDGSQTYAGIRLAPGVVPPDEEYQNVNSKALDYLQVHGITIDAIYTDDDAGQYSPKRASSMRAQSSVRGRDTVQHPQRLNATYLRPRPIHVGVPNEQGQSDSAGVVAPHWHHTDAGEVQDEQDSNDPQFADLFSVPVELTEPIGTLHIRQSLLPTAWWDLAVPLPAYNNRDLAEVLSTYYRAGGWIFRYELQTLPTDGSTWEAVASTEVDRTGRDGRPIRHYMTQLVSTSPWIMGSFMSQLGGSGTDIARTYREGRVYGQDAQVMTQNLVDGQLDLPEAPFYDPSVSRQATRLVAQAQWVDFEDTQTPQEVIDLLGTGGDSTSTMRLASGGFSVYQLNEVTG